MTKKLLSVVALGVAASVLALVLAGSIGNVRAALAQESATDPTPSPGQSPAPFGPKGYRGAMRQNQAARRAGCPVPGAGVAAKQEALSAAAQAMGLTLEDLLAEIKSGKSIAQVAESRGASPDSVKDAMLAALGVRPQTETGSRANLPGKVRRSPGTAASSPWQVVGRHVPLLSGWAGVKPVRLTVSGYAKPVMAWEPYIPDY